MSVLNLKHFLLVEAIVLSLANTESVPSKFTRNPANNFTTYQLKVPGSHDPITIIEDMAHSSKTNENADDASGYESKGKLITRRNGEHYDEQESQSIQQRLNNRQSNSHDVRATLSFQVTDPDKSHEDASDDANVYSPALLKKFIRDYSEKMKNADQSTKNALKEIEKINRKHLNGEDDVPEATTDRMDFSSDDEIEQKYNKWNDRYTQKHHSQSNPYNDKDGWVTLEAVPWSSSKVSKWYPHSSKFNNKNSYDSPLSHQPSFEEEDDDKYYQNFPKPRPTPSHYNDEFSDDYIDDQPTLKPIYTSYDPYRPQTNNRPQSAWSQNQNTGYEQRPTYRPRPRPQYDYSSSNSNSQHQSYDDDRHEWYDRNTPKPWSQDIITDDRPSDFPYRDRDRPTKRPQSPDRDPNRTKYRPFSHPDNGNGDWILVSTTKGYQAPKRDGKRAMNFTNINANDFTSHHTVKLTVLPAKNDTFSYDRKPMALSHGGMLEVESSFESVEDSAALASSGNKPFSIHKKRKVFRNVPMKKGITSHDDGSAVLAAVGAGMVPATMAMLMPMVLGRRKRNTDDFLLHKHPRVVTNFK